MSLTFYFAPHSTASITLLALEQLGTPCERVKLDFQKGDTKKPEFLKLNPNGLVPTLVHDGTSIWEASVPPTPARWRAKTRPDRRGETAATAKGVAPRATPSLPLTARVARSGPRGRCKPRRRRSWRAA